MEQRLLDLHHKMEGDLHCCASLSDVDSLCKKYLNKDGEYRVFLNKELSLLHKDDRAKFGKLWNTFMNRCVEAINRKKEFFLVENERSDGLDFDLDIDVSVKLTNTGGAGAQHPIGLVSRKIIDFFISIGFQKVCAPEIDLDYYNFEALNFPIGHPARGMQDTFYVNSTQSQLLRTHTSNAQIRVLESLSLEDLDNVSGYVSFGKCYRNEDVSSRSHMFFHQIEAFAIGPDVSDIGLMSVVVSLCKHMFGDDVAINIRHSYFPFVAPGYEIDISCLYCKNAGCALCKFSGWLEILGCGVIHPNVLKIVRDKYEHKVDSISGYAMGLGVERIAMLLYGIDDLRLLSCNIDELAKNFIGLSFC